MNRIALSGLVVSASALLGIALHEGYRADAYLDGVNVATIGFGSTEGVKLGDKITVERALIKLGSDISRHEAGLRKCLGDIPLLQREWDALTSWVFNVGVGAACSSTLVKKARAGDYAGMCAELLRWNRAGGREMRGLTLRRQAEFKTCSGS